MARGRVWQGIRDWFRPADGASSLRIRSRERLDDGTMVPGFRNGAARVGVRDHSPRVTRGGENPDRGAESDTHVYANADRNAGADWPSQSGSAEAILEFNRSFAREERELLDFLAADVDPVPADPVFRERLKDELWEMVRGEGLAQTKGS